MTWYVVITAKGAPLVCNGKLVRFSTEDAAGLWAIADDTITPFDPLKHFDLIGSEEAQSFSAPRVSY